MNADGLINRVNLERGTGNGVSITAADIAGLAKLHEKVKALLVGNSGQWYTLRFITAAVGSDSTASVSARIRDLRKPSFGALNIKKRNDGGGVWSYRHVPAVS